QPLDADVLSGRAAEDGVEAAGERGSAEGAADLRLRRLVPGDEFLEEAVVLLGDLLDQVPPPLVGLVLVGLGDRTLLDAELYAGLMEEHLAVPDEVDEAGELFVAPDGKNDRHGVAAELLLDLPDDAEEIG